MKWITWGLLITLINLQYQIWLRNGGLRQQYTQMQQKAKLVHQQNEKLRRENMILRAEVADLQNGYEAISEIVRTEKGYIEQGETFYNLTDNNE